MELSDYRKELDSIDAQMLELFKQRMNTVRGVAEYKKENKLPVLQQGREREILAAAAAGAGEELEDYARTFFATLMDVSRSYQERLTAKGGVISETITDALKNTPPIFPKHGTVACQGVEGAYSQLACDKLFTAPSISYFKNFEGVFAAVEQGLCEYGILPIENSTYGTVNEVYDLMKNYRFHIVRSIKLKVDHSLLVLPGTELKDVKEIFSHEQAIGQCSEFLKAHPGIKVTVCDNTAAAAKMLHESGRLRESLRSEKARHPRPEHGRQLHPFYLHLKESHDLPRRRQNKPHALPAAQTRLALFAHLEVLRPRAQPHKA